MERDYAIVFKNVTKTYPYYGHITAGFKNFVLNIRKFLKERRKRFVVLDNISFEVYRGECFGVVGRNGAGKSTLLALTAGVLKPDKGEIIVRGRVLPLLELGAGFHPDLTGRENIILNGVLLGATRKEIMKKMDKIIDFAELWDFIDQPLRTYSSGMIARLGFSIVIHLDPEILLIDEILAVGDIAFQEKCVKKIKEFRENGVTILLVSHNLNDITTLCDRAMWIENHKIKAIGDARQVVEMYKNSFLKAV